MKISNETKVGALTAVAITLLILGFNFLKGRNLFSNSSRIYAKYTNVAGLAVSNQVMVNGLQIGTVYEIKPLDKTIDTILVTLNLTKDVNIPDNSVAFIKTPPLGTPEIDIQLGNAAGHLKLGDTILTKTTPGLLDDVMKSVDPVLLQVTQVLHSVDSVMGQLAAVLDPNTKGNLRSAIANLNKTMANLTVTTADVNQLLNSETGSLAKTMNNLSSFTGNLAKNNDTLTATLDNLHRASSQLADANIGHTLRQLDSSTTALHGIIAKINSTGGSVGALINDRSLYNSLYSTTRSLNTLLDDLKVHPKRYISISVFGKKDKSTPLKAPLSDDSTHNSTNP
jgi:phospholipid/cholesterol/gamma-HCH transport system substrate-binding protein